MVAAFLVLGAIRWSPGRRFAERWPPSSSGPAAAVVSGDRRRSWSCRRCSPATVGGQPGQGLAFAVVNVVLLVGRLRGRRLRPGAGDPVGRRARRRASWGRSPASLARALPLLLLIQIVLFINTEMWQVADGFDGLALGVVVAMFVGTGGVFLVTRLPRELDELATFADGDEVRAFVAGTPAEALAAAYVDPRRSCRPSPLTGRQRLNVSLVALFSQGMQITLVTLLVGAFFVVFGLLTITPEIMETWLGHPGDELFSFGVLGHDLRVHRRAPEDQRLPRRVLRPLLHGGARHRRDVPQGVPRGDPRRAAPDLRRAPRVPPGARRVG